jgi:hypothetical protein
VRRFVVVPGHELHEIEEVLFRCHECQVVKKHGDAAELATAEDPRT